MAVIIRGAGDIATGIALRLHRAGFQIIMTDLPQPTSIRRTVCFSEALRLGEVLVEDVRARRTDSAREALGIAGAGEIAVVADPTCALLPELYPAALVDAILAKRNLGTSRDMAPVVIGVGPGFTAGEDCHAAVETMRGHTLGRVLYRGTPIPNTGIPGIVGGYGLERVLRAPAAGVFEPKMEIGQMVKAGQVAALVGGVPMLCTIDGCLRGLLQGGLTVPQGMKCGDIDPRCKRDHCFRASDKALAVGGGVLEALLHFGSRPDMLLNEGPGAALGL